ncbi:hypothetical protein KV205_05715 [Streptomyces sp. SKN60]|uniref:hypothetical protein n=1 Tax=Streptomyces sp. SKN60 TaxID=2855506 RepID=UPI002247D51A|nr:hypothetical protein [Streptomyces sp. SKN60]MCX2180031.1 hypothetical protein [Streptomyces sp. SKN60]
MMTRIARGLAGAALAMALAATTACGGGGDPDPIDPTAPTTEPTASPEPDSGDSIGTLYPGKGGGGQAAPARMPTAKVGEPRSGRMKVKNSSREPMNFAPPQTSDDDPEAGETTADLGTCTGTLAPDESCEMTVQHTAYQPGSYTGTLTVQTSQGETLTVPFSGEAVEDSPTETVSPSTETPLPTEPTPTDTPLPTEPTETETDIKTEP